MKKIISLVIIAVFSALCSLAQVPAFEGIPLDVNIKDFETKIKDMGFSYVDCYRNFYLFEGTYNGFPAELSVFTRSIDDLQIHYLSVKMECDENLAAKISEKITEDCGSASESPDEFDTVLVYKWYPEGYLIILKYNKYTKKLSLSYQEYEKGLFF